MTTRHLFVIRHAEARSGPSKMDRDFFLTDKGKEQADALGRELKRLGVRPIRIYNSALTRARQTAEIVSTYVSAPLTRRQDLIEHGAQALILDCTIEEAAARHPDKVDASGAVRVVQGEREGLHWDFSVGGETLRALHERARGAWQDIVAAHPEPEATILIVAHGSFLSAMLTDMLELPLRPVWNFSFANASFLYVRLHGGPAPQEVWPVLSTFCPRGDGSTGWERSETFAAEREPL